MEFSNVTKTQIIIPERSNSTVARPRLIESLLSGILTRRVVALVAAAGYGKTTLLIDVANAAKEEEVRVCWYSIDDIDDDLYRFASYLVATIREKFPAFGQRSASFLQNNPFDETSNQFITILVNEILDTIPEHFIIVLDDFHLVSDETKIRQLLGRLLQTMGRNCHFVVSSRKSLRLPNSAKMMAADAMSGFGTGEIKFTANEVQSLYLRKQGYLSNSDAARIVAVTEGWITGILFGAAIQSGADLDDYFTEQILDRQPPAVQEFLLWSGLLGEFDIELCRAVFGEGDWWNLMQIVAMESLFVIRVGDSLRYHHSFVEFLRRRMRAQWPTEAKKILHRLAEVYELRRHWEAAYDVWCKRLGDVKSTARLINRAGPELVATGRFTLLDRWLDRLPVDDFEPELLRLKGVTKAMQGRTAEGLAYLEQAVKLFSVTDDKKVLLIESLVNRAMVNRFLGNYDYVMRDVESVLAYDENNPGALREKVMVFYHLGQLQDAIEWGHKALVMCRALGREQDVAIVLTELGMAYSDGGNYSQALKLYEEAESYWQKSYNLSWLAHIKNCLGVLHFYRGDYQHALEALETAIELAEEAGYGRFKAVTLTSLGDLFSVVDFKAAQIAYKHALQLGKQIDNAFAIFYATYAQAKLTRLHDGANAGQAILTQARELAQKSPYELALCSLEQAELSLLSGQCAEAIDLAHAALKLFGEGRPVESMTVTMTLARAYHAQESNDLALSALNQVFNLMANINSEHPLLLASLKADKLLMMAKKDVTTGHQANRLLKRVKQFRQDIPRLRRKLRQSQKNQIVIMSPPSLIIKTLAQHTSIILDNVLLTKAIWTNNRTPRELFFFLLSRTEGAARSQIVYLFWADIPEANVVQSLGNAVYKIRKAFGNKRIILLDKASNKWYFNREGYDYEYDCERFDKSITLAQTLTDTTQQIMAYKGALELYERPYLPEIDREWALLERERLERLYFQASVKISELYLEVGDYEQALFHCTAVLGHDQSQEEVHRLSMKAYAALGRQAEVVRQFEWCQQALEDDLAVSVSEKTVTLYESLIL